MLELDLKNDPGAWQTLPGVVLGPTGNLRAPAIRMGSTWLIGFHAEAYAKRFG